jgi:GTP 3',8-cyclase
MYDRFNRKINFLRISVTDRCNFRCIYCMPEQGVTLIQHSEILTFEEIRDVAVTGVSYGIDKIKITGGEPLVRKRIVDLVAMLAEIPGVKDLSMTTNGSLLDRFAGDLVKAGLNRVNISLDTINLEKFREITRIGDLSRVMDGIMAARAAGFNPIKINCVIKKSPIEEDAREVAGFCAQYGLHVRFIKEMDLGTGIFSRVIGGDGGQCATCNRLRLTANGKIRPCLFSDLEFDVRELGIDEAFRRALGQKPESGTKNETGRFSNIGG